MTERKITMSGALLKYLAGLLACSAAGLFLLAGWSIWADIGSADADSWRSTARHSRPNTQQSPKQTELEDSQSQKKSDWELLYETLSHIKNVGEKAESRTYDNKMMTRELVLMVRIIIVALVAIAVVFPFSIWLLSRKRILGLSKLSSELASTLVSVEERQAKLADVLQELKTEIDYLQATQSPDLQALLKQAETYIEQTTADLKETARTESDLKPDSKNGA